MKVMTRVICLFGIFALMTGVASAKDNDFAKIKEMVQRQLGEKVTDIKPSPIAGLYQVTAPPMVFYISKDGRYFVHGDIVDLAKGVNISATERANAKMAALAKVSEKDMIIYKPKHVKHVVTVFTDIDCPYCRKLHSEIPEYNKRGIEIRYMAYPRAGVGSPSYHEAVSAWCATNRKEAFRLAIEGQSIPKKTCKNPVAAEYKLGMELGINGTPTIILANGQVVPGYAPPEQLSMVLDQMADRTAMQ